jgi:hypothetical protein
MPAASPLEIGTPGNHLYAQLFYFMEGDRCRLCGNSNQQKSGKWLAQLHTALNKILPFMAPRVAGYCPNQLISMLPVLADNLEPSHPLENNLKTIRESLIQIGRYQPSGSPESRYDYMLHGSLADDDWIDSGEYILNPNSPMILTLFVFDI